MTSHVRTRRSGTRPAPRTAAGGVPTAEYPVILLALSRLTAVGYLLFALLFTGEIVEAAQVAAWLPAVYAVLVVLPGLALGVATFTRWWPRALPAIAVAMLAGFLTGTALWILAVDAAGVHLSATWALEIGGLPGLVWILWRPLREALVVVAAGKTAAALALAAPLSEGIGRAVVIDALFSFAFMSTCTVLAYQVVRSGRLVDNSRERVSETLAANLRSAERARLDAMIHDRVIATLIAATAERPDPRLPEQARDALGELDALSARGAKAVAISGQDLVGYLRRAVAGADDATPVTVLRGERSGPGLALLRVPAVVAAALAEATGEAVRNAVLHAGPDADIAVLIGGDEAGVQITVVDDGVGFDPDAVPRGRLGIELSIRQRVEDGAGGTVHLVSRQGRGTTVHLSWESV